MSSNHSYFELHQIHCKGSCFISENILNLAQFFIKRGRFDRGSFLSVFAVHQIILVDEIGLRHFDNFNRNDQRNRNHCIEKDEISAPNQQRINDGGVSGPINIIKACHVILLKKSIENCDYHA